MVNKINKQIVWGALIFVTFSFSVTPDVLAGSFPVSATIPAGENFVRLTWDPTGLPGYTPGRYRYAVNLLGTDGKDWQTCSASYGKKIRVLNIHPPIERVQGDWVYGDKLKEWMEDDGFGMELITVDKVAHNLFNANPDAYLKENGEYKYDVIMFGSWDNNGTNASDLNAASIAAVTAFWASGRGVLFGHDTLMGRKEFGKLAYMVNINAPQQELPYAWNTSVTVINNGFLLKYPHVIPDNATLTIPLSHSTGQQARGVIWMNFTRPLTNGQHIEYTPAQGGGSNNFYLTTHNNAGMIQTGHSGGLATDDEKKIIANTLMYLAQFTDTTTVDVYCAMDLTPPEKPDVNVKCNKITIKGKDLGSDNRFYVAATDGSTQNKYYSDTISATVITGLVGYYVVENNSATVANPVSGVAGNRFIAAADDEVISYTSNSGATHLHVQAVDAAGNRSAITTILIPSNSLPTAVISYSGTPFCRSAAAQSVSINGTGAYTGGTYAVTPSGLTISSSTGVITPGSSTPGTYTVTYTIPGVDDCDDPVTTEVIIKPKPQITTAATTICAGSTLQLAAQPTTGVASWSSSSVSTGMVGTGGLFTAASVTSNASTQVTYTLDGCDSDPVTISVEAIPRAPVTGSRTGCPSLASNMITWLSLVEAYEGTLNWYQPQNTPVSAPGSFDESIQQTITYWVSQTTGTASCESQKSAIVVDISEAATTPTVNSYNECATVSGGAITWASRVSKSNTDKLHWFTADNADPESTADSTTDPGSFDPTTSATIKTYYVQIEDINGCKSKRAAVNVTVKARPVAVLSGDTEICKGQSANLTVSFTGAAPFNFTYSPGTSVTTDNNSYTVNVSPASTVTYSLTSLSDANNCTSDAVDLSGAPKVTVNDRPAITGAFPVNPLCSGAELLQLTEPSQINDNGSPVTIREWQIGQNATFVPLAFPYNVNDNDNGKKILFIATNSCGSDTVEVTLTVNPLPDVTLNNPPAFCQGTLDSEPDKTITGYNIIWYTAPDGTPTAAPTVQNLPATGSPYSYYYKVQNATTLCESSIHTYTVTVNLLITAPSITKNPDVNVLTCTNPEITLTATGGISYSWGNGDTNASITVNSEGTYEVTVTDGNGCIAKTNVTITENKTLPVITIKNNTNTTNELTCSTKQISLTANGGDTYVWDDESGSSDPDIVVTTDGIYTVTVTNATNGCYDKQSIKITENTNLPTALITTHPATTELTCVTTSITLTASGGDTYLWENGQNGDTVEATSEGTYSVTVAKADNGCSDKTSITITADKSIPVIVVNNPAICVGESATITAKGADEYAWSPAQGLSATTGESVTVNPETTTKYIVEGTIKATGCKSTATSEVYVETPLILTLAAPENVEFGNKMTLTVSADGPDHGVYEWFINDNFYTSTGENYLTLEPQAGRQRFSVDTKTTYLNCPASSDNKYVNVNENIPNIINPHNPVGVNCCFMMGNENRKGYQVEIYNRYMQKVAEGDNGWDGTYRGAPAEPGTYFFRIVMKDGKILKGTLEVIKN